MNWNPKQVCVQLLSPLLWSLEPAKPTLLGCCWTKGTKFMSTTWHRLVTQYGSHHHGVKTLWGLTGFARLTPSIEVLWFPGCFPSWPPLPIFPPPRSRAQIPWCSMAPTHGGSTLCTAAPLAKYRRELFFYDPHRCRASPTGRGTCLRSGTRQGQIQILNQSLTGFGNFWLDSASNREPWQVVKKKISPVIREKIVFFSLYMNTRLCSWPQEWKKATFPCAFWYG